MSVPTHCYNPDLLKGKRALVTGGGTGIGRAIAFELARAGATVTIAARQVEPLQATAEAIASETQRPVKTRLVDIRDLDSVAQLAAALETEDGQTDILINNAGGQFPQAAENYSPKGWRTIIDLNLNGTWNMTQALGQQMLKGRGGVILNIIMTIGRGNPGIAHSGAARAGVAEMTRSLSYEWGPKVRVNCLGPGAIITPGMQATYDDDVLDDIGDTPIPQPGTPEDIANGAVFLVSPAGRFITGEVLMVDGGVSRYGSNQALKSSDFPHRGALGPDWAD